MIRHKLKFTVKSCICLLLLSLNVACSTDKDTVDLMSKAYNQELNVIPLPNFIEKTNGDFKLNKETSFYIADKSLRPVAEFYAHKMRTSTGYPMPVEDSKKPGAIGLYLSNNQLGDEAYHLQIDPSEISIEASTPKGVFYALSTLMQLLPAEIESKEYVAATQWVIPAYRIEDAPRLKYRGLMIDVARHFTTIEGLKKHIDILSMFKINHLHLHLSDYQGWRVEIKAYPKLTSVGGYRINEYGETYGGFYTQDEIRELVAYATDRFVTIIPEIDVPGHTLGAIAAYPELSCTGETYQVMSKGGGFPVVMCPGKEVMFQMLDTIFAEMSELFPSEYFHIGGDECPKEVWSQCSNCQQRIKDHKLFADSKHTAEHKLQSYAIKRCSDLLAKYGKKMIGWDEILEGGLAPDATVMSWRGESGGIASALNDHDVIMTPGSAALYFDHYQGDPQAEILAWGGYAPIEKTYAYNPVPDTLVSMNKDHYIIGVQGNAWSESMYTEDIVEYRVYPRTLAVAEVGWTQPKFKDFSDFSNRLLNAYARMDQYDVNYHIPLPEQVGGSMGHLAFTDSLEVAFTSTRPVKMVYTLDGSEPGLESTVYTEPLSFSDSKTIRIRSVLESGRMSWPRTIEIEKQELTPAIENTPLNKGLKLKIADEKCIYVSEIANITQWKDSVIEKVDVISTLRPNFLQIPQFYVAIAEGYINIPADDIYYFRSNNTRIWVANKLAVDNDNKAQVNSKYGYSLALQKGWHPIKVEQISNFIGGWNSQHRNHGEIAIRTYEKPDYVNLTPEQFAY